MVKVYKIENLEGINDVASKCAMMGDDYIIFRLSGDANNLGVFDNPARIDGLTLCLVKEGSLEGEIDFQPFVMEKDSLFILGHNTVISMHRADSPVMIVDVLLLSKKFVQDLNFDLTAIDLHSLVEHEPERIVKLSQHEAQMMDRFFSLLYYNAKENNEVAFSKNIGRSVTQAIMYQMLQMRANRQRRPGPSTSSDPSGQTQTRQMAYVQEFMRLLQLHHMRQRSMAFYADRLCISPKYLSHLIKEATGRSASDWIAECVVHEAKNMLRYSNKNIQQVAYDLNFSTQSSFGKYFKHVTGLSPTEYQKT